MLCCLFLDMLFVFAYANEILDYIYIIGKKASDICNKFNHVLWEQKNIWHMWKWSKVLLNKHFCIIASRQLTVTVLLNLFDFELIWSHFWLWRLLHWNKFSVIVHTFDSIFIWDFFFFFDNLVSWWKSTFCVFLILTSVLETWCNIVYK